MNADKPTFELDGELYTRTVYSGNGKDFPEGLVEGLSYRREGTFVYVRVPISSEVISIREELSEVSDQDLTGVPAQDASGFM